MKVLLATEGSKFSQAAVEKCCKMFEESINTQIRIISAAEPAALPPEPYAVSADYVNVADAATLKRAQSAISIAEAEIRNRFPDLSVDLTTTIVKGSPAQVIVGEAKTWGADVIIVGSHGYGFWQRALLGSVSNSVVHHAPCSVLVVRPPTNGDGSIGIDE